MKLATVASVAAASVMIVLKLGAWIMTDSTSMLSSMVDSILDVLTSLINFFAIRVALLPPDDEHRFGHGKAEDIAALAQSTFIAGSAFFLIVQVVQRFITAEPIEQEATGMIVMVISMMLTLALVLFQRNVIRKTGSSVVSADSLHYVSDILTNGGVLLSFFLASRFGIEWFDPIVGFAIAAIIFKGSWDIGYPALQRLMDHEMSIEERELILNAVKKHPHILGVHNLKTRRAGTIPFIQFDLELDGSQTLASAHTITHEVHDQVAEIFPGAEIIIHQDPA